MALPDLTDVFEFAREKLRIAREASETIRFSMEIQESIRNARTKSLSRIPKFEAFKEGYGTAAMTAVLFVDLRRSTHRAVEHGPKKTYLVTHTLLPTLAHVVDMGAGRVANFRGDGLFALFGLNDDGENDDGFTLGTESMRAVRCGKAMLEAVYDAVNPVLKEADLPSDLNIGIGIDTGQVVITRVGLPGVNEVTAYGNAVNHASKYCGGNGVIITSERAWHAIPGKKGGRLRVKPVQLSDGLRGLKVVYPPDIKVLGRGRKPRPK